MAKNLYRKLEKYVSIGISAGAYPSGTETIEYSLYVEGRAHNYFETWPELLAFYKILMGKYN